RLLHLVVALRQSPRTERRLADRLFPRIRSAARQGQRCRHPRQSHGLRPLSHICYTGYMRLELVSILSSDKLELPGLLYRTDRDTRKAAVWLHGLGDNAVFYKPAEINSLAAGLAEQGIALLAFNNRGAHLGRTLKIADESLPEEDRRFQGGM